jgi:hypothetical protein
LQTDGRDGRPSGSLSRPPLNGYIVGQLSGDIMGLLTELFVAREDVAKSYDLKRGRDVESVKLGGLTNLEFEILWAIVGAEEWNVKTHALEQVASTAETWTFRFPPAYVEKLRGLGASDVSTAAVAWAATEELRCKPSDVEPAITKLVALARSFADARLSLYLWTSL